MNTNLYIKDLVKRFDALEKELSLSVFKKVPVTVHDQKRMNSYLKSIESFIDFAGIDLIEEKYVSFNADLKGQYVRITMPIESIDIVLNDNSKSFDVEENMENLKDIEFEEIYE